MALQKEDIEQLFGEIENQGFGYWIENYGFNDKEKDPKLVELCEKASEAMGNLKRHLQEQGVEIC